MDMEKGIGTILREAREAKQLTVSQVEEKTNIRANYLDAIEKEDFSKTPGEVFVKGIIRTYGNFLGLDGNALVGMYKAQRAGLPLEKIAASEGAIRENKSVKMNISLKQKRDWGTGNGFSLSNLELPMKQLAMGFAAIALLGIMYFAVPKVIAIFSKSSETVTTAVQTNKPEETEKTEKPVLTDKVEVVIEANGKCWTEVYGDGREVFAGMLNAGDRKVYNAKDKLVIKYGNIGVVKITVNGQVVDLKGEHGVATKTYAVGQPVEATAEGDKVVEKTIEPVKNAAVKSPVVEIKPQKKQEQAQTAKSEVPAKAEQAPAVKNSIKKVSDKKAGGDKK